MTDFGVTSDECAERGRARTDRRDLDRCTGGDIDREKTGMNGCLGPELIAERRSVAIGQQLLVSGGEHW